MRSPGGTENRGGAQARALKRWAAVVLSVSLITLSACHGPAGVSDAVADAASNAAAPDARPDAAWVYQDARPRPDALVPWDSGPPVDAVPGSVIQLPPSGQNLITDPWHYGTHVVYSEQRGMDQDVFFYDLMTRQEAAVVAEPGHQTQPYIWQDTVMRSDGRWYSEPDNVQMEIFEFDIQTSQTRQVTNNGFFNLMLRFNTRHVLYLTLEGVPQGEAGFNLKILDRQTEVATLLASYETWWEGADLSETHVSWAAHTPWESGSRKSVYLHHLATGTTELLMSTVPASQYRTSISGDWVIWEDDRNGNWDIYAYQISTGQEIPLVTEPHDQFAPYLCDDLVIWGDYRWSGNILDGWQKDLVIYDLSTGFWRRVTGWTDAWIPAAAQAGWLVYRRATGQFESEVYAMDLVANLILNPSGRVIP